MAIINKPSQPLIPPTDVEEVEEIATNAAAAAIAADDTHAPLVDDKVPAANLPSYVDDVLNFDSADEFPEEGEEGKIYVANDTNLTYRWSGVAYIQVGGASLAPGDGIDIENDIVSVDMDYVTENLDHVTQAELTEGLATKQPVGNYATSDELTSGLAEKATNFICHVTFDPNSVEDPSQPYTGTLSPEDFAKLSADPVHTVIAVTDLGLNAEYYLPYMSGSINDVEGYIYIVSNNGANYLCIVLPDGSWMGTYTQTDYATAEWVNRISDDLNELGNTTYRKSAVDNLLAAKANIADTYTKAQVDTALAPKANSADVETALGEKQDKLEFNPTIPSGTTPAALSAIKDGENYYAPDGTKWTILPHEGGKSWVDQFNQATKPYILLTCSENDQTYYLRYLATEYGSTNYALFGGAKIRPGYYNGPALDYGAGVLFESIALEGTYAGYRRKTCLFNFKTEAHVNWTSEQDIPTAKAIQTKLDAKQDTLVSGTNIKTINNQSVLGEGNLEIGGNEVPLLILTPTGTDEQGMPIGELSDEDVAILTELPTSVEIQMTGAEVDNKYLLSLYGLEYAGAHNTPCPLYAALANGESPAIFRWSTDLVGKIWGIYILPLATETEVQEVGTTINAILQALPNKQDTLVSATNIKTINGQSILGSGDLEIALSQSAQTEVQSMIDAAIGNVLTEEF